LLSLVGLVHAATAGRYDAQRNELYFLACGWHPDFGYFHPAQNQTCEASNR
jgi:hypothetical protein